ncbi:MAG: hypothetical protein QG635_1300, partial [Bacteroidota bacterium]|nr:hypothetical protein [Bacteroidota bacterium]
DADYTFTDAVNGEIFGSISKGSTGSITVKNPNSNTVKILKANVQVGEAALSNYPNPVEKSATIAYTLPENNQVTIKLYDTFGNEMVTLLNEFRNAGSYSDVMLDASELVSGAYILKLTSGSQTLIQTVKVVK